MATALGVKSKAALRIDGKSTSGIAPDLSEYPTTTTEASDERCALKYCDGIPMKSESMEAGMNFEEDETLLGGAGAISQDNVSKLPSGSISMTGRYNGLDAVFALALGYEEVYRNSDFYPSSMSETALTAGTCSASTFVNSTGVFASSDEGKFIKMVGTDANSGQIRRISGYNSTTSVDVTPNWDDTPDSGDSAELAEFFTHLFHTSQNAHDELLSDIRTDWSTRATNSIFGANDKVIRRGYLGVYKGDASYTNFSRAVKADSLEISCQAGGSMEVTLGLNAFDRLRSTASISDITKWGDPDWNSENLQDNYQDKLREKVMFNDLSGIYVAPHETLLGSDHARKISGFTISLNNNLQSEDLTAVSGLYRTEPVRGGMKEITGSFTIPRYDSDTWLALFYRQLGCPGQYSGHRGHGGSPLRSFQPVAAPAGEICRKAFLRADL